MTPATLTAKWPRCYQAHELRSKGLTWQEVGRQMGIRLETAFSLAKEYARRLALCTEEEDRDSFAGLTSHGRCGVCGLLHPHECLATVYQLASSRAGDSSGLT